MRMTMIKISLKNVLETHTKLISSSGISWKFKEENIDGSYSVSMDSEKHVGTVTFWPEKKFEFQFNCCRTGEMVLLETKEFESELELSVFMASVFSDKLTQ